MADGDGRRWCVAFLILSTLLACAADQETSSDSAQTAAAAPDGRLIVNDHGATRVTIFSPTGDFESVVRIAAPRETGGC